MDELRDKIFELKAKRNAVLLAHNYQREEVQAIADFTGDSLELSRRAATMDCDVIVFCGVNFMAESASILSPDKTVLLPATEANCPMADMVTVDTPRELRMNFPGYNEVTYEFPEDFTLRDMKRRYPGVPVVSYVNTTAAVKAESDYCCTSSNAVKLVNAIDSDRVICVPDRNLAAWIAANTKKEIITWDGFCHVHDRVRPSDVDAARAEHQGALFVAHPECRLEICQMADHVTSTSGMLRFCRESDAREFIIGTETGLLYRLRLENPHKKFHPLRSDMVCPNMKRTTLRTILFALENNTKVIKVPEEIRVPAKRALDRMLEIG